LGVVDIDREAVKWCLRIFWILVMIQGWVTRYTPTHTPLPSKVDTHKVHPRVRVGVYREPTPVLNSIWMDHNLTKFSKIWTDTAIVNYGIQRIYLSLFHRNPTLSRTLDIMLTYASLNCYCTLKIFLWITWHFFFYMLCVSCWDFSFLCVSSLSLQWITECY